MSSKKFEVGDLVEMISKDWSGIVGIVSQPINEQHPGHVLIHKDDCILGRNTTIDDVELAGETSEGFAQLGYFLIKLGSHVIEKKLLIYRG